MAGRDPWAQFPEAPAKDPWPGTVIDEPLAPFPLPEDSGGQSAAEAAPQSAAEQYPGTPTAATAPTPAQPAAPVMPGVELDPSGTQYDAGFGDELPTQAASRMAPEDEAEVVRLLQNGADASTVRRFVASKGFAFDNVEQVIAARDKNGRVNPDAVYQLPKPVEYDGAPGALARGAMDTILMGTPAKLGAVVAGAGAALSGGDFGDAYGRMLDQNNGVIDRDEDEHPWMRVAGQLLGGIAFPPGMEGVGLKAGTDVLRAGGTMAEARVAAKIAARNRMAAVGAGYGAAHGGGSADSLGEAVTGAAAEGALGAVGGAALGQLGRVNKAAVPVMSEGARVGAAAARQGVDILPQDVGSPLIGRATQGVAQTPFGAGVIRRAADKLYGGFRDRVASLGGPAETAADVGGAMKARSAELATREVTRADDATSTVSANTGVALDETGAGQVAKRGVARFMDESAERANALYGRIPIPPTAQASVANTRGALRDLTGGMESNPDLGAMFDSPRLRGYLQALTPRVDEETGEVTHSGTLSWNDLQDFRTRVGDSLDDPRLADKIAPRQLRALYGALSEDMRATATDAGPDALRSWRRANDYYDGRMKRIKDTLSLVLGERRDRSDNAAFASLNGLLRSGSTGNAAAFMRVLRSMSPEDAATVRATIVQGQRGGPSFDPDAFAKTWGGLSERGKSALLPNSGLRTMMDDAATRAAAGSRDPLAGHSAEQAFLDFERMASIRGDSAQFQARLAGMPQDEANAARALLINRMGLAKEGGQNATGDAFSIGTFLTRWNIMTPQAKKTLFGSGDLRSNMDDLALIAEHVKASERMTGHSNTGAVNAANAMIGVGVYSLSGMGGVIMAALAQRGTAEMLTSKRLLQWITKAPKKPNPLAQRAHVQRLTAIARSEPAIAADIFQLQARLQSAFNADLPTKIAAEERLDSRPEPEEERQPYNPSN